MISMLGLYKRAAKRRPTGPVIMYKKKVIPKTGQVLLLNLLWRKLGGPAVVAKVLGVPWYAPGNWNRDGQVPIKYMAKVATSFDVPLWGLNYKVAPFIGLDQAKVPKWDKVAKMYGFEPEQVEEIIRLGEP